MCVRVGCALRGGVEAAMIPETETLNWLRKASYSSVPERLGIRVSAGTHHLHIAPPCKYSTHRASCKYSTPRRPMLVVMCNCSDLGRVPGCRCLMVAGR